MLSFSPTNQLRGFYRQYKGKEKPGSFDFEGGDKPNKYSSYVYDAVWLYARAMDKLIKMDKNLIQDLHSPDTIEKFVDIIKEEDFDGVSGRVNFKYGPSRLSEVNIFQWIHDCQDHHLESANESSVNNVRRNKIGVYTPNYDIDNGTSSLDWYEELIHWRTKDGTKPSDQVRECGFLSSFAAALNLECQIAITLAFLLGFVFLLMGLLALFAFLKIRYERRMKATEERMRALGLLTPMSFLALDDWEMPRDRVVMNRKLGEGAFGTVYGGESFFDDKGWVSTRMFHFL